MKTVAMISVVLLISIMTSAQYLASPKQAAVFAPNTGAPPSPVTGNNAIMIENFSFSPAVLTIPAGTTVTWTNKDDIPHTVMQRDQKFKSKALDTDDSFSYTFSEPGTYEYFCSLHPKMTAKIVVEPK